MTVRCVVVTGSTTGPGSSAADALLEDGHHSVPPDSPVTQAESRADFGQSPVGVLTHRPETLTNDFVVNLLDVRTEWSPSVTTENIHEGRDRVTGDLKWTATAADLVFGSNSQLRGYAEYYACDDSVDRFVRDFVAAWGRGRRCLN